MSLDRRRFLSLLAVASASPLLARCGPVARRDVGVQSEGSPQRLRTSVERSDEGPIRYFDGVAAPEDVLLEREGHEPISIYSLFPAASCPFAIDRGQRLGDDGWGLSVLDRTLAGILPPPGRPRLPLNMIPFGVALDGVLLDPSGPWYDGGPADPDNPFDRACSGWEYDPIFPSVADLVGVPLDLRGHVQPGPGGRPGSEGTFHYHGTPELLFRRLRDARGAEERDQPFVVGWSADGYWILDSVLPAASTHEGRRRHLFSGYVLREGPRVAVEHTNVAYVPQGQPDGLFVQDWVHDPEAKRARVEAALREHGEYHGLTAADIASGDAGYAILDAYNGLVTEDLALPGAPSLTYVYVMTPDWPEIPRFFAHVPAASFRAIIPFEGGPMGPPGRSELYTGCDASRLEVHRWGGQEPY